MQMAAKLCKICEKTKDSKEDFYARNGRVCRDCKSQQSTEHKKAVGGKVVELLEEILAMQHSLSNRMNNLENGLSETTNTIDDELTKIRRKLKKITLG